jgi:hypothetical protein
MRKLGTFHLLWSAIFVSQTGAHLLTLALSAFLLTKTGSLLAATNVFVFSYLPGAICSAHLGRLIDRKLGRKILVINDMAAVGLSLLCGWVLATGKPFYLLCALLSLRSISTFFGRAAVMKWVRMTSAPQTVLSSTQLMYLGFFLSTTLSGTLAIFALGANSIWPVVALNVVTYLIGIVIFLFIDDKAIIAQRSPTDLAPARLHQYLLSLEEMLRTPRLFPIVATFVLSVAVFQGAYCILINYLPLAFATGRSGIGWFQLAASLGILAGFALNRIPGIFTLLKTGRTRTFFSIGGVLALFAVCASPALSLSIFAFFFVHFLFESVWLAAAAELVALSPSERVGEYQFIATSTATLLMSVWALVFATTTGLFGPVWATVAIVGFSAGVFWLAYARFGTGRSDTVGVSA